MHRRTVLNHCAATATTAVLGTVALQTHAQPPANAPNLPPTHVAEVIPGAIFSGSARMRFLGFDVYDAALWVAPSFKAAQYAHSPLVLELTYLRSLNGRSIAQRSVTEMRRAGDFTAAQEQRWLAAMETSFPDVKATDRITGVHSPAVGARFWYNGIARAPINEPEFSHLFFGIWLSPATSEPKLRAALLANAPT